MDEFEPAILTELVGMIYEAAVDPDHWHEFVTVLERAHPESRVTLFGHNNGCPTANLAARVNFGESDLRNYADYYIKCSPYIARASALPVGRPFHYDVLIGDDELKRTEYYNDYLRPRRLGHYGTGLIIERDGPLGGPAKRGTVLSFADHKDDARRRARQLRLLDLLAPHLRRAFRLHRTVVAERVSAGAAQAAFDHWAHAAVVFDSSARVVTFNLAAEMLFKRADGLWLGRSGQLCAADEAKAQALEVAIRKCATVVDGGEGRSADLDGITLPRPSGAAPLRVMMWPLASGVATPSDRSGAVLAMILDPTQVQRTPVAWLAKQFGLSPGEQKLTEAIVNGTPLAEAAEQLGIQLSTARTRLKTIQTKTNCRRQVDLVRLALSLPAVREA